LPRMLAVSLGPAAVLAVVWLRLESPAGRLLAALGVTALALLPALVRPGAARLAAAVVTLGGAALIAFDVSPLHPERAPGSVGSAFGNGLLDFFDVRTPFDPRVHAEMQGVVLAAVFGFVLALSFAVAARRPIAAAVVLLLGAGWPATLHGSGGSLPIGAAILLGTLAILAGLTTRHVPRAVLPAALVLTVAGLAASTSTAVAKGGLVSWQGWDFYTAPQAPVSVAFVWNGQYSGITFPRKRTTVLEVHAPPRSLYWRAALLDLFAGDRWLETPSPLRGDALLPAAAQDRSKLLRQDVRVLALSDTRLVGASVPVSFSAGDAPLVSPVAGIASLPSGLTRGFRYTVLSYAQRPTAAELARSRPIYPVELVDPGAFLDVDSNVTMPPFGTEDPALALGRTLIAHPELVPYAPLAKLAVRVAGHAGTPYAATAALETWFRVGGGFAYANHPPATSGPPLVEFVTKTRAGYCQHFAGAMALMLRYLGIPARVAVGFSSGRYDAKRGVWTVTDHDAHAWVEAWFRGYGWLPFDPTPAARPGRGQLSAPYAAAVEGTGSAGNGGERAVSCGGAASCGVARIGTRSRRGRDGTRRTAAARAAQADGSTAAACCCCSHCSQGPASRASSRRRRRSAARATRHATRGDSRGPAGRSSRASCSTRTSRRHEAPPCTSSGRSCGTSSRSRPTTSSPPRPPRASVRRRAPRARHATRAASCGGSCAASVGG